MPPNPKVESNRQRIEKIERERKKAVAERQFIRIVDRMEDHIDKKYRILKEEFMATLLRWKINGGDVISQYITAAGKFKQALTEARDEEIQRAHRYDWIVSLVFTVAAPIGISWIGIAAKSLSKSSRAALANQLAKSPSIGFIRTPPIKQTAFHVALRGFDNRAKRLFFNDFNTFVKDMAKVGAKATASKTEDHLKASSPVTATVQGPKDALSMKIWFDKMVDESTLKVREKYLSLINGDIRDLAHTKILEAYADLGANASSKALAHAKTHFDSEFRANKIKWEKSAIVTSFKPNFQLESEKDTDKVALAFERQMWARWIIEYESYYRKRIKTLWTRKEGELVEYTPIKGESFFPKTIRTRLELCGAFFATPKGSSMTEEVSAVVREGGKPLLHDPGSSLTLAEFEGMVKWAKAQGNQKNLIFASKGE